MGRMVRFLFVSLGFVLLSTPAGIPAQEAEETPPANEIRLDLGRCVEIALENNSTIVQGQFTLAVAEAQVDNARAAFLPTLSSNYRLSRSITGPREGSVIDESTGLLITALGEDRVSGSQSTGASLGMTIFDPADFLTLSANQKAVKAQEMTLDNTRQQVVFQAKQAYFQLLQAIKLLEVQQEQIRVSEESLRRAETLYEIGSAPLSNVYSFRSQLESARVTLITRENDVEIARSNLSFVLGLGLDVRVVPTEEEFAVTPLPITYQNALERALQGHPSLVAQKYSMMQAKDNLRATQYGVRFPTVSASAGYNWNLGSDENFGGIEDLFMKNYSYSFGLSVNLPIFNRLSTENQVKIQKLQYLRSQEQLDQARRQMELELRQSFLNIERFRRSISANEAAVQAAEEEFKLAEERYNFGAGTFLERLQAQTNLFQARNNLVQAIYNYQIQIAQLQQRLGGPIQGITQE